MRFGSWELVVSPFPIPPNRFIKFCRFLLEQHVPEHVGQMARLTTAAGLVVLQALGDGLHLTLVAVRTAELEPANLHVHDELNIFKGQEISIYLSIDICEFY